MDSRKKITCGLMALTITAWGFEFIVAKQALDYFDAFTLLFFKFLIAATALFLLQHKTILTAFSGFRKKDIPMLFFCSGVGMVAYYAFEYMALAHISVGALSVILAFAPLLTIVIEGVFFKCGVNKKIVGSLSVCILGAFCFIGLSPSEFFGGQGAAYLLALGALFCWISFNFAVKKLQERYESIPLIFCLILCSAIILAPIGLPKISLLIQANLSQLGGLLYLAMIGTCFGLATETVSIKVLGVTPTILFSNFIPVGSSIFAWILLGERLSGVQLFGGVLVVAAGVLVIREKDRLDRANEARLSHSATAQM